VSQGYPCAPALPSVGFRTGFGQSSLAAMNRWFSRKKGLAMSIVTMGYALGGAVIAPMIGMEGIR